MSALDASYAETQRRAWQQQQAWQTWWREDRTSTLNALIARGRTSGWLPGAPFRGALSQGLACAAAAAGRSNAAALGRW
jgi:hypothetical protein